MFAYPKITSSKLVRHYLKEFPKPSSQLPIAHIPSLITRSQVEKILPLLESTDDRARAMNEMLEWNAMTAQEQVAHSNGSNGSDFFEIGNTTSGGIIIISIYRMDDNRAYLRLDPHSSIVIRQVTL